MTNFDFLLSEPQFASFAKAAVTAEKIYAIDAGACAASCRRAMECAVKWMYSVDDALERPADDRLVNLLGTEEFRDVVGTDLWRRLKYIRQTGNEGSHAGQKEIAREEAALCLENLWYLMDFIACCYGQSYEAKVFDRYLLEEKAQPVLMDADNRVQGKPEEPPFFMRFITAEVRHSPLPKEVRQEPSVDLDALIAENKALRGQLSARRAAQQPSYVPKPLALSEYNTRRLYIDAMLRDAGWIEGQNWVNEVPVAGMPNRAGEGFADYVLYDDAHRPLAVIEAKKTCVDPAKGRQQAKLYADGLERQYGRRPVIFLTNGFETRIDDGAYPERPAAAFYSRRDLEKLFNLRAMRTRLNEIEVDRAIAGRWYQAGAVQAVCQAFAQNRRRALLVMATGSGKTRTVIALCKVLLQHGWVKNICV